MTREPDIVDEITDYEQDNMSDDRMILFFQRLIDSGLVWNLQGSYGRTAAELISRGICHPTKG